MRRALLAIVVLAIFSAISVYIGYKAGRENPAPIRAEIVSSADGRNVVVLDHSTDVIKFFFLISGRVETFTMGAPMKGKSLTKVKRLISVESLPNKDGYPQALLRLECQDGKIVELTEIGKENGAHVRHQEFDTP